MADYAYAENTVDHSYSTRWESADGDENPALTVSFGDVVAIDTVEVRFEYPWEKYYIKVETSVDGKDWNTVTDCTKDGISGSPVSIPVAGECKFVRLAFCGIRRKCQAVCLGVVVLLRYMRAGEYIID